MTEETFHVTAEDLRKLEGRESKQHSGIVPKGSDASVLKSIVYQKKGDPTENQANLPLPEDPFGSSDMKSADARHHIGVGSGRFSADVAHDVHRQPATQASAVREDGEVRHKETTV